MGTWAYKMAIAFQKLNAMDDFANGAVRKSGDTMTGTLDMNSNGIVNLPAPDASGDAVEYAWAEARYRKLILTADFDMNSNQLTNLKAPAASGNAVEYNWAENRYLQIDGSKSLTGDWSAGVKKITNLAYPIASGDAANKEYVDKRVSYGAFTWYVDGAQTTGAKNMWLGATKAGVLVSGTVYLQTPAVGCAFDVDVERSTNNGTSFATVFTTRITVDANEYSSRLADTPCVLSVTNYNEGDIFRVNVITIGSSTAGSNLTVQLHANVKIGT